MALSFHEPCVNGSMILLWEGPQKSTKKLLAPDTVEKYTSKSVGQEQPTLKKKICDMPSFSLKNEAMKRPKNVYLDRLKAYVLKSLG